MRVLIINLRIGTGSVGRIVSDLYHGIIESGNECKVAYARGGIGDLPIEDTIKICSDFEVNKHAALTRLFGNTAFWSKKSTNIFLKKVDQFDPDIIHIHGLYGYYINMEVLFKYIKEHNIQLISTLHSCWDFTGHCCYFDYSNCTKWKENCEKCKLKNNYPKSSFLDNTKKNFKRKKDLYSSIDKCIIVSPSRWLAELAKQSFLKDKDIKVIPNGISLSNFDINIDTSLAIEKYSIDTSKMIILCVASIWDKRKGISDILELSTMLNDSYQLIVVGLSNKQIDMFSSNTITIERTDNALTLASLYKIADVFFNPTYEDNYPTVNLESIACGTPVVTYKTGGSPEIIDELSYGLTIEKKDYRKLLEFCNEAKEMKKNLDYDRTQLLIGNELMKERYIKLYEKSQKNYSSNT